ncbi:hypothetical protein Pla52o_54250 [Novipirellula galeiformis]|uniref:Uncharacterized protein n=1 Tax=Novipirellula galeiformis TaxID=2528004 RepID=A0A5C6BY30_9BACT|nr:hypothetical protein [Novipirellula galeiformis]TWU17250.1 hypothetical protein Pla52o_54250 [Novipirellula galeiformis]
MHSSRRRFLKSSVAGASIAVFPAHANAIATGVEFSLPVAMNLSAANDYSPGFPFKNLLWGARPWLTRNVNDLTGWDSEQQASLKLDREGYPLQVPFVGADGSQHDVFTILPNTCRPGRYVLLYDGQGKIESGGRTQIVKSNRGRVELQMMHARGDENLEILRILKSDAADPIHNMRMIPIELEHADLDAEPFLDEVVEYCKQFHALRFMDWLETNDSINRDWAARKTTRFFTQCGVTGDVVGLTDDPVPQWQRQYASGVALELCIDLANATKCDAWLCVPHLADDDYIFQMAVLVKERLDPDLKVYVEYSNEVWNWQFQQAHWNLHSAAIGNLLAATPIASWQPSRSPKLNQHGVAVNRVGINFPERMGIATRRILAIWERVFAGRDRNRLVRVAAGQASWQEVSARCLNTVVRNGGCDAFTVSGYFAADDAIYRRWEKLGADLTAAQVIEEMKEVIASESARQIKSVSQMCQRGQVDFVVYEGGQHLQPRDQQATSYMPALKAAQFDRGMAQCYRELLRLHAGANCRLFTAYASVGEQGSRYGSWGHLERYTQAVTEMPKMQALVESNAKKR